MIALITFGIALVATLLLVPGVRRFCLWRGYVAQPREDRWHHQPTAKLGGIAIFVAFIVAVLTGMLLGGGGRELRWGLLLVAGFVFVLGLYDDIKELSPQAKLVGQILAATAIVLLGYTTKFFSPRIENEILAQIPNIILTYLWVIGITNAINLLDNMDGLAAGIALIAAVFLSFFFWQVDNVSILLISTALAGSVLGFLVFNFPPASIFMGDSGSLFLGFTLSVLAIARQPQASNVLAVMGVPIVLFLLPILDTVLVTFTRILRGQSPAQGGRDHTSHRLVAFGLNERQTLFVLYAIALLSGITAAVLESLNYRFSLVLVPALILALAILAAYLGRLKVVVSASSASNQRAITRFMVDLTYRRRLLEVGLDFVLIGIAYYLAFLIHYGLTMSQADLMLYLRTLPIAYAGTYISFFIFGVYRGLWRYVGVEELVRYLKAILGAVALMSLPVLFLPAFGGYPAVLLGFYAVFLLLSLAASRLSFKVLDQAYAHQTRERDERVLIYGAGDAGEMALRWIMMNPQLGFHPVGFLDDDIYKTGRQIHGVEVLGAVEQLTNLLEKVNINGVIIAVDTANDETDRVLKVCRAQGLWVRNLRFEFELIE
jgi:UDP-GlcNAc:undecaprenyl-phosphate GlcNAc-1-phosphate transferase